MSVIGSIASVLMTVVSIAYPPAAPIIAIAKEVEPFLEDGLPILKAAITEGPAAFAAAKEKAPDLFAGLQALANKAKANLTGNPAAVATDHELANFGAHVAGIDPPGWTHEETQRWWEKASGDR